MGVSGDAGAATRRPMADDEGVVWSPWLIVVDRDYSKRKFSEIQEQAKSGRTGWKKLKDNRKKPKWARK